ncbi:unnamed protein product [Darwinula stevensoni]|uniref:Uncharacterized protein n=1 Tax=Darwinula stevensoni TaxID=69355 RepID=A0A7R9AFX8_9CRUS|nr:unnamed protein product [Darwinula stevensoni]CAG0903745.1 unnamed protein product [Darwinula stevensoni]
MIAWLIAAPINLVGRLVLVIVFRLKQSEGGPDVTTIVVLCIGFVASFCFFLVVYSYIKEMKDQEFAEPAEFHEINDQEHSGEDQLVAVGIVAVGVVAKVT